MMKKLLFAASAITFITLGCPEPASPPPQQPVVEETYGVKDAAWAADSYNAAYRIFPNAPENGILTYPWGSGTNNYLTKTPR